MLWMLIVWTVLVGLGIPGIVLAVRALPWVDARVLAGTKPWACDICMSFWTGAVLVLGAVAVSREFVVFVVAPAAYTIALATLRVLQAPHGEPPPALPPEE